MIFTYKQLLDLHLDLALTSYYREKIKTEDIEEILWQLHDHNTIWSRLLLIRLLNKKCKQQLALHCATLVLPIFEQRYPNDPRIKECIQATKDFLAGKIDKGELLVKRHAAYAAAYAAADATDADADATYAAYAAAAATYATYADATYAAAAAAYAVDATTSSSSAKKDIENDILTYGINLLLLDETIESILLIQGEIND